MRRMLGFPTDRETALGGGGLYPIFHETPAVSYLSGRRTYAEFPFPCHHRRGVEAPQHGSFMRLTKKEYKRLKKWSDREMKRRRDKKLRNGGKSRGRRFFPYSYIGGVADSLNVYLLRSVFLRYYRMRFEKMPNNACYVVNTVI